MAGFPPRTWRFLRPFPRGGGGGAAWPRLRHAAQAANRHGGRTLCNRPPRYLVREGVEGKGPCFGPWLCRPRFLDPGRTLRAVDGRAGERDRVQGAALS